MDSDKKELLKKRIAELYSYIASKLNLTKKPKIVLTEDEENARKEFGLTAYFNPQDYSIRLYITSRMNGEILRSLAHELVHLWQRENGTLTDNEDASPHYAQTNLNLRKRELEAFCLGGILFRDFQDEKRYGKLDKDPILPKAFK